MTDLNRLTNILVDVGDSVNDLLAENKRLRHVLTLIADAADGWATDWSGMPANVSIHMAHPSPIAFAKETARLARSTLGNRKTPVEEPQSREDSDGQTHAWPRR